MISNPLRNLLLPCLSDAKYSAVFQVPFSNGDVGTKGHPCGMGTLTKYCILSNEDVDKKRASGSLSCLLTSDVSTTAIVVFTPFSELYAFVTGMLASLKLIRNVMTRTRVMCAFVLEVYIGSVTKRPLYDSCISSSEFSAI
jgi:hypothetical protein